MEEVSKQRTAQWAGVLHGNRFVRIPSQASCELSGEAVILNLESGIYYGLNEVGARIWELLREPKDLDSIRDVLLEEYEIDAETLQRDIVAIIDALRVAGLVRVSDEHPA